MTAGKARLPGICISANKDLRFCPGCGIITTAYANPVRKAANLMHNSHRVRRGILALLAALLAAAAVWLLCRWVGYDLQERLGNQPVYEILNDDYSQIIDLPEEGLTQKIPLRAGQAFYGVRLKFSTHGQLYKSGMLMVDVFAEDGTQLAQAAGNFLNIFDDTFTEFTVETPYVPAEDETLTVHIYNAVPWDGPLGLWASEGEVDGMPLYGGSGQQDPLDATLAVQLVADYSGRWPALLAEQLALPLAAAAFAAVLLTMLHAPLALLVAVVGLALGVGFTRVTPALVAPDEYTHLAAAYELAGVWSGQQTADENGNLLVRECDAPYFSTKTGEIGIFAYKAQARARTGDPGSPNELTRTSEVQAGQGSGNYWAQAFGIWLARMQNKNFYTMLDYGRLANLVVYLVLVTAAVALAPQALRGLLACVSLLPMSLQLAGSLSPDAGVLGTVFLFTALCMKLRCRRASPWQLVLLVLLAAAVAPAKAIYLPVILLCLAIPPEHLDPRKTAASSTVLLGKLSVKPGRLVQVGVLLAAAVLWTITNLSALAYAARDMNMALLLAGGIACLALAVLAGWLYLRLRKTAAGRRWFFRGMVLLAALVVAGGVYALSHMGGGLTPDQLLQVNPNGDSVWTFSFGYICRNLPATLKLLLRTLPEQGGLWLQGLLGTTLGEPIVYRIDVSWLLGVGLVLALLIASLPVQGRKPLLSRRSLWGTVAILACVILAVFAAALNWTPINYQTLFGMQGRYLLPVLPAALLLVQNNRLITLRRSTAHGAALAVAFFTLLTQLQGFGLYAAWQPVS